MWTEMVIIFALIVLCIACTRMSLTLRKIETILFVQIKNLDRMTKGED